MNSAFFFYFILSLKTVFLYGIDSTSICYNGNEYVLFDRQAPHKSGQIFCDTLSSPAKLLSVLSETEKNDFLDAFKVLENALDSNANGRVAIANIDIGQDSRSPFGGCLSLNTLTGQLETTECENTHHIVCERKCTRELSVDSSSSALKEYFFENEDIDVLRTFDQAEGICANLGGSIANPVSEDEALSILVRVRERATDFDYWLNFRRRNIQLDPENPQSYGILVGDFGSEGNQNPWRLDEPNGSTNKNCVSGSLPRGDWRIDDCLDFNLVVCERFFQPITRAPTGEEENEKDIFGFYYYAAPLLIFVFALAMTLNWYIRKRRRLKQIYRRNQNNAASNHEIIVEAIEVKTVQNKE